MKNKDFEKLDAIVSFENTWWKNLNPKCLKCLHNCKQSVMVEVLVCPQFKRARARGKS